MTWVRVDFGDELTWVRDDLGMSWSCSRDGKVRETPFDSIMPH